MIRTNLLRSLDYILKDTYITCTTLHLSLDIAIVYFVSWSWYKLYSLSGTNVLDKDSWSYYTESHTILHLYWLIKLTKPGLLGKTGRRKTGRCVWKGDPLVGLDSTCDLVFLWFMTCYYMLHDTWVQWTVSPCYQDSLTHYLFDMQLSCGMGHRMIVLV